MVKAGLGSRPRRERHHLVESRERLGMPALPRERLDVDPQARHAQRRIPSANPFARRPRRIDPPINRRRRAG
ncbi:hypothetical protein AB0M50_29015 [Nonomuraea fuscirosea]|uniref:hypothetical protein n=1 Tax=Nonomuraea fuscirosea TaxID=1291556 RepID=UPI002DDA9D39|nr:hypothetical protein [Nonomuraea fuscirosea]WSA54987.1 hypothetical protein OIE67_10360 [Nonomuraea fuscirosea]